MKRSSHSKRDGMEAIAIALIVFSIVLLIGAVWACAIWPDKINKSIPHVHNP